MPAIPESWRDEALEAKWAQVRKARRTVLAALERKRTDKEIRANLEAAPTVFVPAEMKGALASVDFADVCITSQITISDGQAPEDAFRLTDAPEVAVVFARADGEKCQRCWKVLPDVGSDPEAPGACGRCASVVKQLPAAAE